MAKIDMLARGLYGTIIPGTLAEIVCARYISMEKTYDLYKALFLANAVNQNVSEANKVLEKMKEFLDPSHKKMAEEFARQAKKILEDYSDFDFSKHFTVINGLK